jgi:hypothetical protein
MWLQQLGYALISLILVTGVLLIIGLLIYIFLKKFSRQLFKNEDLKYLNIVFVGTVLIALSQLFGPLVASTYPIICGTDASDYSLSFDNVYINLSYNSTSGNYSVSAAKDSSGHFYGNKEDTSMPLGSDILFNNRIVAINSNPLISYNNQIFLSIIEPDGIITSLSNPVIEVGRGSNLTIKFMSKPYPGTYQIKVRGTGGDGKIREAMMVIGISVPLTYISGVSAVYTPFGNSFGYGSSYAYDTHSGSVGTYTTPTRPINITSAVRYTPTQYTSAVRYEPTSWVTPTASFSSGQLTPTASCT